MTFTRIESGRIRDGSSHPHAVGPVVWESNNGSLQGKIEVRADDMAPGSVMLVVSIGGRPNRPSFVLVINGDCHCRLDVHQAHRSFPGTHLQWRDDSRDSLQTRDARGQFPPIPENGDVPGEDYRATLQSFAASMGVDTSMLEWIDPPLGGKP